MAQINLSGSIGVPGSQSVLGNFNVVFASNGPHTMTANEFSNYFLNVTSGVTLTTTQNLVSPLNQGQTFIVQNNTTGGQAIQVIGTSGTGVTVVNGSTVIVVCDGTKYLTTASGAASLGGDLTGTTTAAVVIQAQGGDILFNPTSIEFASTATVPALFQALNTLAAGQNLTVQAQGSTASLQNGGNLILASGTSSTGTVGNVSLAAGGTTGLVLQPSGVVTIENLTLGLVHADSSGNLTSSPVVDADISGSAAIAVSKLATGTSAQVLLNSSAPLPTWTSITGDISLSSTGLVAVTALQGNPVENFLLGPGQDGYVLTWKNSFSEWQPTAITNGSVTLAGDVTGPATSNTVVALYNQALAATVPVAHAVPVWDVGLSHYDVRQLTSDDIAPGFSISSFTGGSVQEIGATVTNPTFTASYSATPSSAQITNTDAIDSPLTLSFPYTSGTVVGSFHHTAAATVTFTLTAVGSTTKMASSNITFEARAFAGIGAAGAVSATADVLNAMLNTGDVINNLGLFTSVVGQIATVTPSNQKVYFLLVGGSHTFTTNGGAFSFSMLTPTPVSFVNINSATVPMYLYESTNLLSATFIITIAT